MVRVRRRARRAGAHSRTRRRWRGSHRRSSPRAADGAVPARRGEARPVYAAERAGLGERVGRAERVADKALGALASPAPWRADALHAGARGADGVVRAGQWAEVACAARVAGLDSVVVLVAAGGERLADLRLARRGPDDLFVAVGPGLAGDQLLCVTGRAAEPTQERARAADFSGRAGERRADAALAHLAGDAALELLVAEPVGLADFDGGGVA